MIKSPAVWKNLVKNEELAHRPWFQWWQVRERRTSRKLAAFGTNCL